MKWNIEFLVYLILALGFSLILIFIFLDSGGILFFLLIVAIPLMLIRYKFFKRKQLIVNSFSAKNNSFFKDYPYLKIILALIGLIVSIVILIPTTYRIFGLMTLTVPVFRIESIGQVTGIDCKSESSKQDCVNRHLYTYEIQYTYLGEDQLVVSKPRSSKYGLTASILYDRGVTLGEKVKVLHSKIQKNLNIVALDLYYEWVMPMLLLTFGLVIFTLSLNQVFLDVKTHRNKSSST